MPRKSNFMDAMVAIRTKDGNYRNVKNGAI